MSKRPNNQKGLIPTLRFPEFLDTMWDIQKLNELAQRVTRKNKSGDISRVLTNSAIDGVVDQRDYFEKDIANQNNLTGYYVVEKGDYVYNPRISSAAPVGPISKNKVGTGVMSPLYTVFKFKNPKNDFYDQYFKSPYWHHYLKQVSNSGARHDRMSISSKDFDAMPLPVTTSEEQQKIADCLSSLDELITGHARKLEALQSYKKGLMQNIFPSESETTPKLRFSECLDKDDWRKAKLEEIYSFKTTNSFSRDKLNYKEGMVKNIHYGDIHTKFNVLLDVKKESIPYINKTENLNKIKVDNFCVEGDIIFADASENIDDVGKCIEIINLNNESVLSGLHTILARQISMKLIVGFSAYLFQSNMMRSQIKNEAQGAKVLGISATRLKNIDICYPLNLIEQQKIVDCLSSLDSLITNQCKNIESLKAHKKGLMQQLFPSMELIES